MGTPSTNVAGKFAVKDGTVTGIANFDGTAFQYEFLNESMRQVQSLASPNGIRGTRSIQQSRWRIAQKDISGSVTACLVPVELDQWLPRALGAAAAGTTFALAETLPEFGMLFERVAERYVYTGCFVDRMIVSGQQNELVTWTFDILGKTEVATATVFPVTVPVINSATTPYIFSDTTFSLAVDASAAECRSFQIVVDNHLERNHFMNSVTRTQIVPLDRTITLTMTFPYTADEIDIPGAALASGGTHTLTLTNGGVSTLFTFGNLKAVGDATPTLNQRQGEVTFDMTFQACQVDGGARELVVTHDSTP